MIYINFPYKGTARTAGRSVVSRLLGCGKLGVCSIIYTKKLLGRIWLGTEIVSYRPRRLMQYLLQLEI